MKKIFGFYFGLAVLAIVFTSCATNSYSINRIRHNEPALSAIPAEAYTVLERVTGMGSVSSTIDRNGLFEGDTGLYGSLDSIDAIYLNINKGSSVTPKTPYDAALANAIYQMIERADELKADAIVFVKTKTKVINETGKNTISVQITGSAIKLK